MCGFWLADALHGTGHHRRPATLFEKLLDLRNDVGLLSEEYDPHARRHLGNTPHTGSMVGLVNTARRLAGSTTPTGTIEPLPAYRAVAP